AATGEIRWRHQSLGKLAPLPSVTDAEASPVVLSQGALYIESNAGIEAIRTSDGSLLWQQKLTFLFSAPIVSDGAVYVGNETLYAFDAADGKQLWSLNDSPSFFQVLAAADGVLYVEDAGSSALEALRTTDGTLLWKVDDTKPYFGEFAGVA